MQPIALYDDLKYLSRGVSKGWANFYVATEITGSIEKKLRDFCGYTHKITLIRIDLFIP
jgi:hypothetical protein